MWGFASVWAWCFFWAHAVLSPPKYLCSKRAVLAHVEQNAEAKGRKVHWCFLKTFFSLLQWHIWAFVYITVPAAAHASLANEHRQSRKHSQVQITKWSGLGFELFWARSLFISHGACLLITLTFAAGMHSFAQLLLWPLSSSTLVAGGEERSGKQ